MPPRWAFTMDWFRDSDNQRLLLLSAALGLILSGTILAFRDQVAAAGAVYAATFMVLIFFFLSRFKRFKGFGIEAELWEQEMEQAEKLKTSLRFLSETFGEMLYMQFGPGSRWGGIPQEAKLEFIEKMDRHLLDAGLTRDEINEKKSPWHKCVMRDLANPIAKNFGDILREKEKKRSGDISALGTIADDNSEEHLRLVEERKSINDSIERMNDLIWRDDWESVPSVLRDTIDESLWITEIERQALYSDCKEEFLDIDHYGAHQEPRRIEAEPE